ncbi:MAG: ABC transporter substrate-binding protein [Candidatus Binatia bacterium]|nr:ABC transporter substrate-binding protein [Candidatus Binatia bacterium]
MTGRRLLPYVLGTLILLVAVPGIAAERFYVSIVGPTLSYVPLYYAQEKGFFAQEGFDLQVLIVRGVIGVSSLMSGEIDVTCHAGSGLSAALRGVPIKIISVTRDRPVHELLVAPNINSPAELKGKAIAVGSLDGTAAVMTRRILQAKGLDAQKDVNILSMDSPARLQSLFSGRVAGAMMTPPSVYLAQDQGYKVFGRGRDYMRFLQTGVVTTDANIKQKREKLVRFLKAWNRGLKAYQDSPEIMIPYIQKRLGVKDPQTARRMYDDDAPFILSGGRLGADAAREIVDIGREALHLKEPIPTARVFDFSLASEALR